MMSELASRRCRPCEGGVAPLTAAEAEALLARLHGWGLDGEGKAISKVFHFKGYHETMGFANAVAWIAYREDHHPVMEVGYRQCRVRYTTNAIGGLSENDFICAAKVDALVT